MTEITGSRIRIPDLLDEDCVFVLHDDRIVVATREEINAMPSEQKRGKYIIATDEPNGGFAVRIVDSLPSDPIPGMFYLMRQEGGKDGDYYDEYVWNDGTESYELIGSTRIEAPMLEEAMEPYPNSDIESLFDSSVLG